MIYLSVAVILAITSSLHYLTFYGLDVDWRDPVAVNAWCVGVAALLLSLSGALYCLGHYQIFGGDDYREAFLVACAGFTVLMAVMIHRSLLIASIQGRRWWNAKQGRKTN